MSSLPASIKRIGSKTTKKRWRHHFPLYKSMRAFCCHGNQSFDSICPNTLCSLSPSHPRYATHKIWSRLANWLQRYSSLKVWTTTDEDRRIRGSQNLLILKTSSPKGNDRSPETNVPRSNVVFSKGSDQKTTEKRWRYHFPHYKSMGAFCCYGQSFDPTCLKTLWSLFPPHDATHKIWSRLANWPQRYSS